MKYSFQTTKSKSKQMSKFHSTGGIGEVIIRKILWRNGIRYRINYKKLPGKPDIAITKYKIVVFIDGEFWHGYECEKYKPRIKCNRDYWIKKIEYNMQHDKEVNNKLKSHGRTVLRFWSKNVLKNPDNNETYSVQQRNPKTEVIAITIKIASIQPINSILILLNTPHLAKKGRNQSA